jgi:hypothetical protein
VVNSLTHKELLLYSFQVAVSKVISSTHSVLTPYIYDIIVVKKSVFKARSQRAFFVYHKI